MSSGGILFTSYRGQLKKITLSLSYATYTARLCNIRATDLGFTCTGGVRARMKLHWNPLEFCTSRYVDTWCEMIYDIVLLHKSHIIYL